nr:MAG TPA: hypothetical protein [Caudoviricetes sp.]
MCRQRCRIKAGRSDRIANGTANRGTNGGANGNADPDRYPGSNQYAAPPVQWASGNV